MQIIGIVELASIGNVAANQKLATSGLASGDKGPSLTKNCGGNRHVR